MPRIHEDGSIPQTEVTITAVPSAMGPLGVTHLTHGGMQVQLLLDPDSGIELGEKIARAYHAIKRGQVNIEVAPAPGLTVIKHG